ncbi:MAG TPA: hypothetical protein VFS21_28995 [Roseiflexaceae bacterium]|nr:hypothetical protein [Roseiflexaceae bacterium]
MAEPIVVVSKEIIEKSEFEQFFKGLGFDVYEDDVYDGQISDSGGNIWFSLESDEYLQELLMDLRGGQFSSKLDILLEKLEGDPKSLVLIDIARGKESSVLAVYFAYQILLRWTCVVYDLSERVYTSDELYLLYQQKEGFIDLY